MRPTAWTRHTAFRAETEISALSSFVKRYQPSFGSTQANVMEAILL
jgi:hypothetical protein